MLEVAAAGQKVGANGHWGPGGSLAVGGGHFLKQIDDQIDWHPLEKWLELLYHAKLLRPNHHF